MKKKYMKFFLLFILIPTLFLAQEWRTCIRVIDGDTIELDGGEKVRLIGVDTPETKDPRKPVEYFGQEAYEFTKKLIEGKKVRLEYDQNKIDKYGRTLAYVFLEDGTFVNVEIIRQGYGFAYTKYPFKYLEEFRAFEREARENRRGLWASKEESKSETSEDTIVYITKSGKKYHREGCRYLSKSKIPISLKEAIKRGYTPCSVCRPPTLKIDTPIVKRQEKRESSKQIIVYITRTGSKYHRAGCSYLRRSRIAISLKEACARGYTPCSRCRPPRCK